MTKKSRKHRKLQRILNRLTKECNLQSVYEEMYRDLLVFGSLNEEKYLKMVGLC